MSENNIDAALTWLSDVVGDNVVIRVAREELANLRREAETTTHVCLVCKGESTSSFEDIAHTKDCIPRDLHDLYKEAAERWAEGCIYKTFNPETVADFACTHCDRKGDPIEHTADCKAARILDLPREGA